MQAPMYSTEQFDTAFSTIGYDYYNMTFNSSCDLFPTTAAVNMTSL